MSELILIAALTWPQQVIGFNGKVPWNLPEDILRFKRITDGHPVIMGRKTWESLPFKLPGRTNCVWSRRHPSDVRPIKGATADIVEREAFKLASRASEAPGGDKIYVIGGHDAYTYYGQYASALELALIYADIPGDTTFPIGVDFYNTSNWIRTPRTESVHFDKGLHYEFMSFRRRT